jgi:thiamine biosynthesis lipoprotein
LGDSGKRAGTGSRCRPRADSRRGTGAAPGADATTPTGRNHRHVMTSGATVQLRAMGTGVTIATAEPEALAPAVVAAEVELSNIDLACSRFRPDSDLSRINGRAGEWVKVSPLCIEAIEIALRAAQMTDGLVDPTVGGALEEAGYTQDFEILLKDGPPLHLTVKPIPGWHTVLINRKTGAVRVPPLVRLDLGATAKSLASDRAAAAAEAATSVGVLVSCGGDLAATGKPPAGGWSVRVSEHHADPVDAPGQTILIERGGLATSGVTARRWRRGGQSLHHIIDPATSLPAMTPWRVVTVAASTCVEANIASTAAVILGGDAPAWLVERGLAARLVRTDGSILRLGAWPAEAAG